MSAARLVLSSRHLVELKKLAADALPLESCALLAGTSNNDIVVREVIATKNADASEVSFSIKPEELLAAYRKAESLGLEIVAIFHSHPAPARPSGRDAEFMELNPVPWLILSTVNNEMRAFVSGAEMRELEIVVA
jgi:proteasome lid subunit RPN8/RPN11